MTLPVSLKLRPSRALTAVLLLTHGLALLGVVFIDVPPAVSIALGALLVGSAWSHARRHGRQREERITALRLTDKGELEIVDAHGDHLPVRISAATSVFAVLVVLLYQGDQGRRAVVLPVDALGKEGHRILRVWLRWRAAAG